MHLEERSHQVGGAPVTITSIAQTLFLSRKTVDAQISQIILKHGLSESPADHRRVLAVLAFLRSG